MKTVKRMLPVLIAASLSSPAWSGEREELLKLKNTTLNLIEALVKEGILSQEGADRLMQQAELSAAEEARRQERMEAQAPNKVVRVPYVPEFVKDEIRQQVRAELREDVVGDVLGQAEQERWGIPDALPEWTQRVKIKGDIRVRAQSELYSSSNTPTGQGYVDYQKNNTAATAFPAMNTDQDRHRERVRLRLGITGKVTNNIKAGIRIATGNSSNPVSTNQTMGETFQPYDIVLDRAYIQYDGYDTDTYPWLTMWGGRMPNPFLSTDLVWDSDVNFEGVAAKFRHNVTSGSNLFDQDERNKTLSMTLGAFPIQEVSLSQDDKWLFAGQLGWQWIGYDQTSLDVGLAYYNYHNIEGRLNSLNSTLLNYTAPDYMQKGNSLYDISNNPSSPFTRFGLAADYDLLNLTVKYDLAKFAPLHMVVAADYVRNIGYNVGDIRERIGSRRLFVNSTFDDADPADKQIEGYYAKFTIGWPDVSYPRNWQASIGYKYLERDAVLDAFTDSDFHLGGTNTKGWIIGGKYGLTENTWIQARYLSADEITGLPLGIDLLQLDINAKF